MARYPKTMVELESRAATDVRFSALVNKIQTAIIDDPKMTEADLADAAALALMRVRADSLIQRVDVMDPVTGEWKQAPKVERFVIELQPRAFTCFDCQFWRPLAIRPPTAGTCQKDRPDRSYAPDTKACDLFFPASGVIVNTGRHKTPLMAALAQITDPKTCGNCKHWNSAGGWCKVGTVHLNEPSKKAETAGCLNWAAEDRWLFDGAADIVSPVHALEVAKQQASASQTPFRIDLAKQCGTCANWDQPQQRCQFSGFARMFTHGSKCPEWQIISQKTADERFIRWQQSNDPYLEASIQFRLKKNG